MNKMMKKVLLAIVLCVVSYVTAFCQTDENKNAAFQLSFVTPLSTNGLYSSQYTNQVSFNVLVGVSKNEKAFTLGGLSNIIMNDATGFQFAGLSNYVGNEGKGFQLAGLANVNRSGFNGFQFAGLVNTAGDVDGLQFAGLVNRAKRVDGVQLAGLINIAEDSDCPIGLVNIIKNGEMGIAVTYDAIGSTVISFRSGGKYTYGILGVGYNYKIKENSLVTEGGLGAHIPVVSWFRINNEIKASSIGNNSDKPVLNGGYSLIPAFKIGNHCELFAGVSINYMRTEDVGNNKIFPDHSLWKKSSSTRLEQVYIGYQVGVHYLF